VLDEEGILTVSNNACQGVFDYKIFKAPLPKAAGGTWDKTF